MSAVTLWLLPLEKVILFAQTGEASSLLTFLGKRDVEGAVPYDIERKFVQIINSGRNQDIQVFFAYFLSKKKVGKSHQKYQKVSGYKMPHNSV